MKAPSASRMSASPDLSSIIAQIADNLSTDQLKLVLLNAIPQRELRWFQPPTPPGMPGLRVQPTAPPPVWGEFYAPGFEQQFPDNDALEYLEEIRNVVLAQNPDGDPRRPHTANLANLLHRMSLIHV
jgi:hypothetical protein